MHATLICQLYWSLVPVQSVYLQLVSFFVIWPRRYYIYYNETTFIQLQQHWATKLQLLLVSPSVSQTVQGGGVKEWDKHKTYSVEQVNLYSENWEIF